MTLQEINNRNNIFAIFRPYKETNYSFTFLLLLHPSGTLFPFKKINATPELYYLFCVASPAYFTFIFGSIFESVVSINSPCKVNGRFGAADTMSSVSPPRGNTSSFTLPLINESFELTLRIFNTFGETFFNFNVFITEDPAGNVPKNT